MFLVRLEYDTSSGQSIVKELAVPIEERPKDSDPEINQAWPTKRISQCQTGQTGLLSIRCRYPNIPSLHRESLSSVMPVPEKIASNHDEDIAKESPARQKQVESHAQYDLRQHEPD